MSIVIIDTEYTTWPGALESNWSGPGQHREIVQIGAVRVDDDFNEQSSLDLIVRPSINFQLSELFIKLSGIQQATVDAQGLPFREALQRVTAFCDNGKATVICMSGDGGVFHENCKLSNVPFSFFAPFHRLRPFLEQNGVDVSKYSSGDLHTLTPKPLQGHTHNALHDARSMAHWLRYAKEQGIFKSVNQLPTNIPAVDPRSVRPVPRTNIK